MSVKLRLQRFGRKQAPFYHIVAADARSPRDGKFLEKIGTYNPLTVPATIELDNDAALRWIKNGAQPTDTVLRILGFKGVMYRKHLLRGVSKGAMTMEQADKLYADWVAAKEVTVSARKEKKQAEVADFQKKLFGTKKDKPAPVAPVAEPVAEEAAAPAEESSEEQA